MDVINTLRPRQNGRRFADDTFKCIFLNENVRILIMISLKFVPNGPINNNPELVQIMAWRRSGDKPLSEPMMVRLPTHICVTRPQWVKVWDEIIHLFPNINGLMAPSYYLKQWGVDIAVARGVDIAVRLFSDCEIKNMFKPNLNGIAIEVWKWMSNLTPHSLCNGCNFHAGIKVDPC